MNKVRAKVDQREKGVQDAAQSSVGTRRTTAKGDEVQVGCRGISRTRRTDRQRSASWDFDNKPIAVRARGALRDVEQQSVLLSSSRRSTPRASSVNSKRPGSLAVTEKSILARAASPVLRSSHLAATSKGSPALQIYRDESLSKMALTAGKASSRPGPNKIVSTNSPLQAAVARRRSGENKIVAKASPLSVASVKSVRSSPVIQIGSRKSTNSDLVRLSAKVEPQEEEEEEGLSSIQSSLHGRLSLLEGRVSQMAAELRETKELLDASNPISSKVLLTDIHSKITNIERCMTGSPVESSVSSRSGRFSSGGIDSASLRERILTEKEGFKKALQSLTSSHRHNVMDSELLPQRSSSMRFPKDSPALEAKMKAHYDRQAPGSRLSITTTSKPHERLETDHSRLETISHDNAQPIFEDYYSDNPTQTLKPLKTRPSLHQKVVESLVSQHEKSKEDRELLCMKLAEFGGRGRVDAGACDEGALVAAEFLTSLDGERCFQKEVGKPLETLKAPLKERKSSLPLPESSENSSSSGSVLSFRKHRYSDEASDSSSSEYSSPSYHQSAGEATENPCSTLSIGSEFADINHLKLSDGSHISRQLPKSELSRQPMQFRTSEGEVINEPISTNDLRCDKFGHVEAEEVGDLSVLTSVARNDEEGLRKIAGKKLLNLSEKNSTAGWFVCEGEGILLAHEDSSCSYHDVANMEEKAIYRGPTTLTSRVWGDCWIVRAPGSDGRANKFVVAASASGSKDSAFCSWDFHSRKCVASHHQSSSVPSPPRGRSGRASSFDQGSSFVKDPSVPGSNFALRKWLDRSGAVNMPKLGGSAATKKTFDRSTSLDNSFRKRNVAEEMQNKCTSQPLWWYRPCGPLLASAASGLTTVSLYDIRDGESVMRWETQKVVAAMAYSSPLQWRNKSKLVLAELECLSFWDVESLEAKRIHTVNLLGKQLRALHVYNVDAECSGGVRQRLSSSDHHSDGTLCTNEAVNVLDFRVPTGIAKKFPTLDEETQSIYADGDAVYSGALTYESRTLGDGTRVLQPHCRLSQWSMRQGKLMNVYSLPHSNSYASQLSISQVWGSSDTIMAANGNGLFVFEPARRHSGQGISNVRDVLGPDDLRNPTFDFASSRVLLVSRNRPAMWSHWP
ncbi:uncharacterized protein [Physcomitrium patens]|uniref:At4g14310 8-bladed propeller domain-containing protein n=1 Tax=Physcomitrium patens TaxID=3218 RepID=A0A2K1J7X5_PHYPA|nr:KIN14B-interacting protein At4g14310-like [Physcomitrium patens]PNR37640.1 hypothetical protein PHYPA_020749 [Physcomitrium patens]|eukprot:XP_024399098.1 KIN14B-interacting protein At4g14310-like [Physcomitrella patens]